MNSCGAAWSSSREPGRLSGTEIRTVRRRGRTRRARLLRLYALRTTRGQTRLALTVSGRLGKAVVRNRLRRRLRELVRLTLPAVPDSWDLLLIAHREATTASFWDLQADIHRLWRRAGISPERPPLGPQGLPSLRARAAQWYARRSQQALESR